MKRSFYLGVMRDVNVNLAAVTSVTTPVDQAGVAVLCEGHSCVAINYINVSSSLMQRTRSLEPRATGRGGKFVLKYHNHDSIPPEDSRAHVHLTTH